MRKSLLKALLVTLLVLMSSFIAIATTETILTYQGYGQQKSGWDWATNLDTSSNNLFLFTPHPARIYALTTEGQQADAYWASDSLGFRPNALREQRLKSQYVVVTVGDSFTYGHGVNHAESYPAYLEANLRQQGKSVTVYNAGVPGYGPDQEYLFIRDEILPRYKPDVVIWEFDISDFNDSNEACLFKKHDDSYEQISGWKNSLYLRSLLWKNTPPFFRRLKTTKFLFRYAGVFLGRERATIGCTKKEEQGSYGDTLTKIQYFINDVQKMVKYTGTTLVATLSPFQYYFDKRNQNNDTAFIKYYALRNFLQKSGLVFIDLNSSIAEEKDPILFSLRTDTVNATSVVQSSVLGFQSETLVDTMFLDVDGQTEYGNRHLNNIGNGYVSNVIVNKIIQIID